jgi:hypothetical protein
VILSLFNGLVRGYSANLGPQFLEEFDGVGTAR